MYDLDSLLGTTGLLSEANGKMNFVTNWLIVGAVLAIVAAILLFFFFINTKKEYKGFWGKVKEFLSFKIMYIEALLKMFYIASTVYVVFLAIAMIVMGSVQDFFVYLFLGPIVCRAAYEFAMLFVKMWKNSEKK